MDIYNYEVERRGRGGHMFSSENPHLVLGKTKQSHLKL